MNKNIINIFLVGTVAISLASCSENTWNDHFLKGFEGGVDYENTVSGTYSLTTDDYEAISKLMQDKAQTDAEKAEAKAIATNCYFNKYGSFPASVALPPFLETASFPYYLASNGSIADISYAEASEVPEVLSAISGATEYTVSSDDYKNAWGSDVDYIAAFAPMTSAENKLPAILKTAIPDAEAGAYAIVRYNESATNPIFISNSEVEEFIGGTFFLVADGSNGAATLATDKNYGYLPLVEMAVTDGTVTASEANAFTFIPAAGGYYIKDVYGRYLYQKGTYNTFNVSTTLPESGAVWTVDIASNGQATITNTEVGKWIQFDGNYSSWGSYPDAQGSLPVLYKAPAPKYYLVTEDGHGAGPAPADKGYGYLGSVDMTVENGIVVGADPTNAFTFELAKGGYYIKDSYGRYLYQKGTYNNFNLSTDLPEEGGLWTLTEDANGLVTITNNEVGKWIQYDGGYNNWGSYDSEKGSLPKMYNAAASAAVAATPAKKVVAGTPVTTGANAVYEFDGTKWAPADGVLALQPSDYEAMGVANGSLTSPEIYIPMYLKNKLPYAQIGDQMIVVYNYNKTGLYVYDGANWTLNNNGLEEVVGRFSKKEDAWSFTKYIGKALFDLFNEDQVMLDRNYILVAGNVCAKFLDKSSNYGYIYGETVTIDGTTIVLSSDANAYTLASKATVSDATYNAPEGTFLLRDTNGRFLYMTGTYNSFNIKDTPDVADGAIAKAFLWTATKDADGSWTIKNADNDKVWAYSTKYASYGAYPTLTDVDVRPTLYIMRE